MLSNEQLCKKQVKNSSLLRLYNTSARTNTNRRLTLSNSSKIGQQLSNVMHMSLYLVKGRCASNSGDSSSSSAAIKNPQPTNFAMSASGSMSGSGSATVPASASASGSSSTATPISSQEEYHEGQLLGRQPVAGAASVEEQIKMSKPTQTISHGVISVVGRQRTMEDAVAVASSLVRVMTRQQGDGEVVMMDYDFFAVYDGHGAHGVAERCKERLHHVVAEEADSQAVDQWDRVMARCFARVSHEIIATKEEELCDVSPLEEPVGSMALVVLASKEEIVVANCGRSRAVLFRDDVAVQLSGDHQSEGPEEKEVLEVGGLHSTSASIGTSTLRDQLISEPEVTVHKRTASDEFLVIATDGLWDVVSNDMACDIVRKRCSGEVVNKMVLADGMINNGAAACAAMLVELALARGSKDNISVIVVELQHFHGAIGSSTSHQQDS